MSAVHKFLLHAWCVMPDHLHLLVKGATLDADLRDFIFRFKQQTAFQFAKRFGNRLWQKNYYDHVVRPKESIDSIFWYIWMNPVRKGFCIDPRDYLFSGSETVDWKRKEPVRESWTPPWKSATGNDPDANRKPRTSELDGPKSGGIEDRAVITREG